MAKMIPIYSVSSRTEIERRARELFEAEGCPENRDLELWLRAEADYLGGSLADARDRVLKSED